MNLRRMLGQSLTLRLTLLFALASALVLFLLGLLIGNSVEQHFEELDMDALSAKIQLVEHVFSKHTDSDDTLQHQLDNVVTGHDGMVVLLFAPDGQQVYASQELEWPGALSGRAGSDKPLKWVSSTGNPWRGISTLFSFPANKGAGKSETYTGVVAIDISHHEHFMYLFQRTLWVFMVLAAFAMGLMGWFVVRRGLMPLQAIKRKAAQITANRLHTRLPTEAIPLELADLVATLNEMLSRLEESFQRLLDFSTDLAHELRTPISNLLTQTQVTLAKARTDEEYRDILASNIEEFEHLSRMISDMLFLAKADNKQLVPNRESVRLADEVVSLFEFYEILAEEKAVHLTCTGTALICGDRLMLRRALSNLLSNALRYTPSGGKVTVSIAEKDLEVEVRVENTGENIPAEHLPRLFDRFYRTDNARQRTTDGSGLGLAITRSILLAHGGDISVDSAGGITRFTLYFPVCDGAVVNTD